MSEKAQGELFLESVNLLLLSHWPRDLTLSDTAMGVHFISHQISFQHVPCYHAGISAVLPLLVDYFLTCIPRPKLWCFWSKTEKPINGESYTVCHIRVFWMSSLSVYEKHPHSCKVSQPHYPYSLVGKVWSLISLNYLMFNDYMREAMLAMLKLE